MAVECPRMHPTRFLDLRKVYPSVRPRAKTGRRRMGIPALDQVIVDEDEESSLG